jgi:hypothetical protein
VPPDRSIQSPAFEVDEPPLYSTTYRSASAAGVNAAATASVAIVTTAVVNFLDMSPFG